MGGKQMIRQIFTILFLLVIGSSSSITLAKEEMQTSCLDYDQIKFLSTHDTPDILFKNCYDTLFNTLISVPKTYNGELKVDPNSSRKYFRVTHWNINRGYNLETLAKVINNSEEFIYNDLEPNLKQAYIEKIKQDIDLLKQTDIFLLNEVDIGVTRTQYKNILDEFSRLVKANYTYAIEFLEVDPKLINAPDIDIKKYQGLHGNAIISKFPIKSARLVRLPDYYNWYDDESHKVTFTEKIRRKGAKTIFNETVVTELRHGSRVAIIADIELPNKEVVTVVSTHLENRVMARFRERQLKYLLEEIKDIKNPIILGADFNNFENSGEPTSIQKVTTRTLGDPQNIARYTASVFTPYSFIISPALYATSFARKYRNPTVVSIPVLMRNRNYELFDIIHDFEFSDDLKFDFEGDERYTFNGKGGRLANSNERSGFKGFVSTYRFKRDLWLAIFKIDWLFVKPIIDTNNPVCMEKELKEVYKDYDCKRYFPVFPKTLKYLNRAPAQGLISDHNPISVGIMI